jgi:hypothetical protein
MPQDFTQKWEIFLGKFSQALSEYLAANDKLVALCSEFEAEGYGTGGPNAMTDSVVQAILPACTAQIITTAESALNHGNSACLIATSQNRSSLNAVTR